MDADYYFYEQKRLRQITKRFKKSSEDLPDSLKFAHLNPKVAAFLANKEKQKQEDDALGEANGKKSLMPEISQAFNALKNHLDSSLSNDEDSQRYLFEEAKINSGSVLQQLSRIIYFYDNIASLIPKSLECHLMSGYSELTTDVHVIHREWQTHASREAYLKRLSETPSTEDFDKASPSIMDEGRSTRSHSISSEAGRSGNKKKILVKSGAGLPEIIEDSEAISESGRQNGKRNDSRMSGASRRSGPVKKSDLRASSIANPSYYMSVIQFQLSSKACEEKGWIVQKGNENHLAKEAILEYCVQRLLQEMKLIKGQKAIEAQMGFTLPVVVRYYGDTHKETLLKYRKPPVKAGLNNSFKEGKPQIPNVYDEKNQGKQLMLTTHPDGTTVAYYPSGRPAVVASAAGLQRPGLYTIAFDDDLDMKMLAVFTPSGRGVCYHNNGTVRVLTTIKGGFLANEDGKVIQRWRWPQAQVKLTTGVQFQINQYLSFRCVSENYIVIVFSCQKESARFFVNAAPGAQDKKFEENLQEQLLTNLTFTSKSAKHIQRMTAPKVKSKSKKKKDKFGQKLAELVKSVDIQDNLLYESEADKHLARLQRKTRILIDDWMEHYRVTIGLMSPTLGQLNDSPRKSRVGAFSAKATEGKEHRITTFGFNVRELSVSKRAPSAPSRPTFTKLKDVTNDEAPAPATTAPAPPTVKFEDPADEDNPAETNPEGESTQVSAVTERLTKLILSGQRSKSANNRKKSGLSRKSVPLPEKENLLANLSLCPVALRLQMLTDAKPQCRCNRHSIPYITDTEYELYITEAAPKEQLQIIVIVSSLYPESNPAEAMLNTIYENQNRNRTRPCLQCRTDTFRLLRYDINTAMEGSNHTQPMLLTRHNVVPGMFLIYAGGCLLFCDHIFNGYGNARKDFKKQVIKTRLDFNLGFSLPRDFRFSPLRGKHGPRAPWGGEIGGPGIDHLGNPGTAMAQTPTNQENNDSFEDSQAENLKAVCKYIGDILSLQTTQER
ncbi:uncharacterized protein LOC131938590 isoform X2 [Physella acuta]|uniref:uncharacterized protein LOC131938590 isoform X2 n=1 Tax=Physella acuta TaxID=109671 RepID=UPI0027DC3F56|nr:uncharacterized protein LOC131938590 isoform X2 [Physella acuta]